MSDVIGYVVQVIIAVIALFQVKIDIKPEENYKRISKTFIAMQTCYIIVDILTRLSGFYLIFSILNFLHNHLVFVIIYIAIIALLSPITARREKGFSREKNYPKKNGVFNFAGALAAIFMFWLTCCIIPDFNVLKRFQIEAFVSVFISLSVTLVFLYQSTEQNLARNGTKMDHDPSIRWFNQRINMLHLFNAYFFPIISVVYVIAYTIYCRIYHIQLVMNGWYIFFLVGAVLYFYALSLHPYEYLYKIFLIVTPAILITSTYWLSWFVRDRRMIYIESGFIVINLIVFSLRVICKTKMPAELGQLKGLKGFREKCLYIWNKNVVSFFIVFIIIVSYLSVVLSPLMTERIQSTEAENYIYAICQDTERDTAQLIEKARKMETYDAESESYDKMDYMDFINTELKAEIAAKHINGKSMSLEYDELSEWYKNIPIVNK